MLVPTSRAEITKVLRRVNAPPLEAEEVELRGVLRALHLDDDWLQIDVDSEHPIHIDGVKEVVDDLIGPMVNREVVVEATKTKRGKYQFRDIQLAE